MTSAKPRATIREVTRDHRHTPSSPPDRPTRTAGRLAAFRAAGAGLRHAWQTQINLRLHAAIALSVAGVGVAVGVSTVEWAILVLAMTVVLVAELANTALETAVDLTTREFAPLARIAKDVAAGSVVVAALGAALVGALLFGPRIISAIVR